MYQTWHCSGYERRLCDQGRAFFTPMLFRNLAWYYKNFLTVNVAMVSVSPMDRHGYFNLGGSLGGSFGKRLGGNLGASLGRSILGTFLKG